MCKPINQVDYFSYFPASWALAHNTGDRYESRGTEQSTKRVGGALQFRLYIGRCGTRLQVQDNLSIKLVDFMPP